MNKPIPFLTHPEVTDGIASLLLAGGVRRGRVKKRITLEKSRGAKPDFDVLPRERSEGRCRWLLGRPPGGPPAPVRVSPIVITQSAPS